MKIWWIFYQIVTDSRSSNFKKHHYEYADKFDSVQEHEVAKHIDDLLQVTTWIKNISRDHQNAFWLQTASDKFYSDFIIKLDDGKIIVLIFCYKPTSSKLPQT